MDKLEQWEDAIRANGGASGFAVEQQRDESKAERVTLFVQSGRCVNHGPHVYREFRVEFHTPSFQILNTGDPFLSIAHHLTEEIGEGGAAELRGAGAVEISVIDGLAVGGGAELLRGALGRRGLRGGGIGLRERLETWGGGHWDLHGP